jgi:hypothetical protein
LQKPQTGAAFPVVRSGANIDHTLVDCGAFFEAQSLLHCQHLEPTSYKIHMIHPFLQSYYFGVIDSFILRATFLWFNSSPRGGDILLMLVAQSITSLSTLVSYTTTGMIPK